MQTATKTKAITKTGTKTKLMVVVGLIAAAGIAAAVAPLLSRIAPVFSLSASSPVSPGVAGDAEVMRFSVQAKSTDVTLNEFLFTISSTDMASTGWNTCSQLTGSNFDLRDDGLNLIAPGAGWTLYNSAWSPCSGSEVVAYARAPLTSLSVVGAGTTRDYQVWFDTTGASAVGDDSVRIDIPKMVSAVIWTDNRGVIRNQSGLRSFPVLGNTITY